jgi:hypothetical protein
MHGRVRQGLSQRTFCDVSKKWNKFAMCWTCGHVTVSDAPDNRLIAARGPYSTILLSSNSHHETLAEERRFHIYSHSGIMVTMGASFGIIHSGTQGIR